MQQLRRVLKHPVSIVTALFSLGSLLGWLGPFAPLASFVWTNAGSVATVLSFTRVLAGEGLLPISPSALTSIVLGLSGVVVYKTAGKLVDQLRQKDVFQRVRARLTNDP